jgi:hypothetical protein
MSGQFPALGRAKRQKLCSRLRTELSLVFSLRFFGGWGKGNRRGARYGSTGAKLEAGSKKLEAGRDWSEWLFSADYLEWTRDWNSGWVSTTCFARGQMTSTLRLWSLAY